MSHPPALQGVRIADFTIHAAGPFCTHLLSQLGAQCIKIESRSRPDAFRKPHAVYGRMTAATFDQVSANKLSVRLNLKQADAVVLARRLVALSDIAAESFRPGVMQRLGLGFESLCEVKPDLVMLSLSASGQYGPDSHFAGYAPLFGAWGGLGWMSGYSDGPPVEMRHVMDHSAGLHAALAAVAALHQRRRTGQPQHVDVAAREVASAMIGDALVLASLGQVAERPGNSDPGFAPSGVYATAQPDRWLSLAVRDDAQWQALSRVVGDGREHPELERADERLRRRDQVDQLVGRWLRERDADATARALQQQGVCAHVSWTMRDIADDPHLRARGAVVEVVSPDIESRPVVGAPVRLAQTEGMGIRRLTPALGQDEDYVFGELLGLSAEQRRDLEQREVIF